MPKEKTEKTLPLTVQDLSVCVYIYVLLHIYIYIYTSMCVRVLEIDLKRLVGKHHIRRGKEPK